MGKGMSYNTSMQKRSLSRSGFPVVLVGIFLVAVLVIIFVGLRWRNRSDSQLPTSPAAVAPDSQAFDSAVPSDWTSIAPDNAAFTFRLPSEATASATSANASVWEVRQATGAAVLRIQEVRTDEKMAEILQNSPDASPWILNLEESHWVVAERVAPATWQDLVLLSLKPALQK